MYYIFVLLCANNLKQTIMIKVRINDSETLTEYETYLPVIPRKGEFIGAWINYESGETEWRICEIGEIIYEFNKNNKFLLVEINICSG